MAIVNARQRSSGHISRVLLEAFCQSTAHCHQLLKIHGREVRTRARTRGSLAAYFHYTQSSLRAYHRRRHEFLDHVVVLLGINGSTDRLWLSAELDRLKDADVFRLREAVNHLRALSVSGSRCHRAGCIERNGANAT